ncbi:hypothetical protein SAMN05428957_103112 [Oryzisolibacter propanilivorax]|uniref:Uncharacterized protein n=1 Tax=Oryzisolibacter propanilivorax TaxID=1527607 RepID=A0A1G9RBG9_9BURK|nr:hypothetical protein [Oryzisolibacter propanilivorax]SDM19745.1 hypothetical protein SAMN05428957_103112 [Oryzisolibacter propanilivorax]
MALHFLDFDYSEDEEGLATWDAMASVTAERLADLQSEIDEVLAWACQAFGDRMGPQEEGGLWQYDLQCEQEGQALTELPADPATGRVRWPARLERQDRITLSLSLSGERAFAEAFAARFGAPHES